ncbi:hypothetical protein ACH42_17120 [Endozoicomonas sp. (ex Bugula neritina AB1)]|nr:hypothetical protein ACH42_17120 [Endozoicomonas sp. (ex Bugula neritina AB1)]
MIEVEKIIELATEKNEHLHDAYERSEDLNTLYQQANDHDRELINKVLVLIGAEKLETIWKQVNGE